MRTHNAPTANEVAAIILQNPEGGYDRDLIVRRHNGGFKRIFEQSSAYDPLQYPLLFPYGEPGWSKSVLYANNITRYK